MHKTFSNERKVKCFNDTKCINLLAHHEEFLKKYNAI